MQSDKLTGDFHLQNFDAVDPGSLAPWYARFGHTLDVLQAFNHSGVAKELMVLAGGYTPDPDNDVWVTEDGSESIFFSAHPETRSTAVCTVLVMCGIQYASPKANTCFALSADIVRDIPRFCVFEKIATDDAMVGWRTTTM